MIRNFTALLLISTLALTSPALAGPQEGAASFSLNAGSLMFDKAEKLDDGPVIGVRLGYDLHRNLGLEGSFGFVDTRSNLSASKPQAYLYTYRTDLLYYLLPGSSFVPFLAVGGGIMNLDGSELWGNRTSLLLEYGVGIKYFLADNLALRADGRNLLSFDNNRHSHLEFTGGINYYFNKGKSAPPQAAAAAVITPAANERQAEAPKQTQPAAAVQKDIPTESNPVSAATVSPAPAPASQPAELPAGQAPKAAASTPVAPSPVAATPTARPTTPLPAAAPAVASACPSPVKISRIVTIQNGFEIQSDSPLALPQAITLASPPRLALDIDCATYGSGNKSLPFNHSGVTVIRIGNYPDKLRVVFDVNQSPVPPYKIVKSSQGLKVLFGNSAK